jgi:hypothetical protein
MTRKELTSSWVVDYSAARARAIRWLGDRYLLARPINAASYGSRAATPGAATAGSADHVASPSPHPA